MIIKAKITYPKRTFETKIIELNVRNGMCQQEIVDYLIKNKKKIVKKHGCNLDDRDASREVSMGNITISLL